MTTATTHYKLNNKQLRVLKLTCKFRYISAPLLTECKRLKSRQSSYTMLENLYQQGYLAKIEATGNEHFENKGSRYYLTTKSIRLLRTEGVHETILRLMYKNATLRPEAVDHYIEVLRTHLAIRNLYPDTFEMWAKTELAQFDYFIRPLPDVHLVRSRTSKTKTNQYNVEIMNDTPFFLQKKRLASYIEDYDGGDWDTVNDSPYPLVLLVCANERSEQRLRRHITKTLDDMGMDDEMCFYTTTKELLNSAHNKEVWKDAVNSERLLKISE